MRARPFRPVAIVAAACTAFVLMFHAQSPSASQHGARNAPAAVTVGAPAARAGADFPAAWEQAAKRHGAWLYARQARAEARKAAQEREARSARQEAAQRVRWPSSQGADSGSCSVACVKAAIARYFPASEYRRAMCTANRESRYLEWKKNRYSSASGVFQFVARTWANVSRLAGYGGASVFNGRINVAVAAWTVQHIGWGPWRGGCT